MKEQAPDRERGAERVAVVYCTTTGATRQAAQQVASELPFLCDGPFDLENTDVHTLLAYRALIVGAPAAEGGRLPLAWQRALDQLREGSLRGKLIAIFGVGDAASYPRSFLDSIGVLKHELAARGARFVGGWPVEGYGMIRSAAAVDGWFVGLAIDRSADAKANAARIRAWASQIRLALEDHLDTRGLAGLPGVPGVAA